MNIAKLLAEEGGSITGESAVLQLARQIQRVQTLSEAQILAAKLIEVCLHGAPSCPLCDSDLYDGDLDDESGLDAEGRFDRNRGD